MPRPSEALGRAKTVEQEVADHLPIDAPPEVAMAALERVPFWFHTFRLNSDEDIYTPGYAKDHRYRLPHIPEDFSNLSVLDVGSFDGFYAFLAEHRGAHSVLATDNEQYRTWVKQRWGVELEGGEGFREIKGLLGSDAEYRRIDAFDLGSLDEKFDLIFCFGILHRVESPLGLLRVLSELLGADGRIILETYGVPQNEISEHGCLQVREPGDVYANDDYVYWAFSDSALRRLAAHVNLRCAEIQDTPVIDGHPRIIGTFRRP